jgi:two-component system, NtrC family, sensor kinase
MSTVSPVPISPRTADRAATDDPEVNRRLLLVDDSPAIHEDIRKILRPAVRSHAALDTLEEDLFDEVPVTWAFDAYELDSAYQGPEALALLREAIRGHRPYALAFVDVRMPPGWDGIETINQLWRVDPELQVVICTAYSDHSWSEIRRRLAPSDNLLILRKPFAAVEIRQLAHTLTTKWSLRQQTRRHLLDLRGEVKKFSLELVRTAEELRQVSAERERIETELRLAQKLESLGLVSAGIAHEISTPVQFVGESVELLRQAFVSLRGVNVGFRSVLERISTEEMKRAIAEADATLCLPAIERDIGEALDGMLEGTRRITITLRAMKEFMHPVRRDKAPADINRALLNTLTVASSQYKYVARLETDLERDLPYISCHISDLNQVFLNLIINAAQAITDVATETRTMGLIRVRSYRDGPAVVIEVSDTGVGIPVEARLMVFESFFTTKSPGKGTGQGLSISRSIVVDRHGGEITFTSEVGHGTTFRVRLPVS